MTALEGDALRRAVAEEQGHRVFNVVEDGWYITFNDKRGTKRICSYTDTEAQAWGYVFIDGWLPDYPNDLNTIEDAPLPDNMIIGFLLPLPEDEAKRWGITIRSMYSKIESHSAAHPKPATAFWNAWLEMRKAGRDG